MTRLKPVLLTAALSALPSTAHAQAIYTVDRFRPADFKTIRDALASPRVKHRDVIHVVGSGPYDLGMTTDKGVRILGNQNIVVEGRLRVQLIPASETFAMVAFVSHVSTDSTFQLEISNCAGRVVFDGLLMRYAFGTSGKPLPPLPYVQIVDCAHVAFNQSYLLGVDVWRSRLLVTDSRVDGTSDWSGQWGLPGIRATDADVTLAEIFVQGGSTSIGLPILAIDAVRGRMQISGTPQRTHIVSGPGVIWFPPCPPVLYYGHAIRANGGTVDIDPSVLINVGTGQPPTTGTSTFTYRSLPFVFARRVLPGNDLKPRVHAPDGSLVGLLISALVQSPTPLPPFGDLWLDLPSMISFGIGTVTGGSFTFTAPVPLVTALGTPLTLQAVTLDAKGLQLSLPVDVVIGYLQCCLP